MWWRYNLFLEKNNLEDISVTDYTYLEEFGNKYSILNRIILNTKTSDILSVTNEYFISS